MNIYIHKNNQQIGPFDAAQIAEGLSNGQFTPADLAWYEGLTEWVQLGELLKIPQTIPDLPNIPQVENADVVKTTRKQRPVILWGGALLILLYIASPYYSLFSLIQSLNEGDTVTLKKTVDFPALRESLKDEMKSKLVQQTKRSISSKEEELADKLVSGMGAMFGPAIIDGLVDTFVTPSGLAALIANPSSALDGKKGRNENKIPNVSWAFFSGLSEFQAKITEKQETLTLHFRLTDFRWMLYAITWKDYQSKSNSKADLIESSSKGYRRAEMAEDLGDMIGIPAGEVTFHGQIVKVPAFKISKYEVTINEYATFLNDLKENPEKASQVAHPNQPVGKSHIPIGWADDTTLNPPNPGYYNRAKRWGRYKEVPLTLDSPVFGVDWFDAYAYAKWKRQRLPTEQEWELAAKGVNDFKHPWGNDFNNKFANTGSDFSDNPDPTVGAQNDGFKRWSPVNKPTTDKTKSGVFGMAGNVSEWTDSFAEDAQDSGEKVPVYRGGNWKTADEKTVFCRGTKFTVMQSDDALGFRTAQD